MSKIADIVEDLRNIEELAQPAQEQLVSGTNIKTVNGESVLGSGNINTMTEVVYNLTGTAIKASNGTIQNKTLTANTTFTSALTSGQSILLRLTNAGFAITYPTIVWVGGSAPILGTTDIIIFWNDSGVLYGAHVGSVA